MIKMYNNPMKKRTVYRLFDSAGNVYIGSTSQKLPRRFAEHKFTKPKQFDWSTAKIEPICHTENFAQLEESLIKKTKNELGDKCKNKGLGCFGPKGILFSEERKQISKNTMKRLWTSEKCRLAFKMGKKKSEQVNCYFEMSKKSHELRWSKMPAYIAKCRKTGEVFGPFKGYLECSKALDINKSSIRDALIGRSKSSRFEFNYLENKA